MVPLIDGPVTSPYQVISDGSAADIALGAAHTCILVRDGGIKWYSKVTTCTSAFKNLYHND